MGNIWEKMLPCMGTLVTGSSLYTHKLYYCVHSVFALQMYCT